MESMCTFPKDTRIWWSTLPGKAGKSGANAAACAPAAKKILFPTEFFRPIFRRHHQNGLVCAGLAHEPRAISPQYSSISRFGTPGPKLQTVTLSLKTHSSISVSVGMDVDPPAHGGPLGWRPTRSSRTFLGVKEIRASPPSPAFSRCPDGV